MEKGREKVLNNINLINNKVAGTTSPLRGDFLTGNLVHPTCS